MSRGCRNRNRKGRDGKSLQVQVQIVPLFCYTCSRHFTDLNSFKNHKHATIKNDGDNPLGLDPPIKTELDNVEQEEEEEDWCSPSILQVSSLSSLFDSVETNASKTTTTTIPTKRTMTVETNTSPLKSHNQNSQNVENPCNSNKDRNNPKCLKSPDGIKILCYICHTRFMSLQKFLEHLKSPAKVTETSSHTWNFGKESIQINITSSKTNYISHDVDDDAADNEEDSSSNHIPLSPPPLPQQQEQQQDNNKDDNEENINDIELENNNNNKKKDPSKLNKDATDCPHCTKSFRKPVHLDNHIRIFHSQSSEVDIDIDVDLNSDSNSDPEYQNPDEYENARKRRRLTSQSGINEDESDEIQVGGFQCSKCLNVFNSSRNLRLHVNRIKKVHQDCVACGLSFEWTCMFRKHETEVHRENIYTKDSNGRYKCPFSDCGRTFSTRLALREHTNWHTGKKPFKCKEPGCDEKFPRHSELYIHKLKHSGIRPYPCPHKNCDKAFFRKADVRRHATTHMSVKPFKCDFIDPQSKTNQPCGRTFNDPSALKMHRNKHTGEIIFTCPESNCAQVYREWPLLKHHVQTKHPLISGTLQRFAVMSTSTNVDNNENNFSINEDSTSRMTMESVGNEMEEDRDNDNNNNDAGELPNENNESENKNDNNNQNNESENHNNNPENNYTRDSNGRYICPFLDCGRTFSGRTAVNEHTNVHTGEKPFKCKEPGCDQKFARHSEFYLHKLKHTGIRPFSCTHAGCDKTFFLSASRNRHASTHLPEKPFKCDYLNPETGLACARTFRTNSELTLHTNVHTKEKVFKCPHSSSCSATFWERKTLTEHIRKKHDGDGNEQSEFRCYEEDCNGKSFTYAKWLKDHQARCHSGFKQAGAICDLCGLTMSSQNAYKIHKKVVHLQEENHLCSFCGAGFFSKGACNRHVFIYHTKDSPYPCQHCSRQFRFQCELNKHIEKVHTTIGSGSGTGENPSEWTCDWNNGECNQSFPNKGTLKRHAKTHTQTEEKVYQCPVSGCVVSYRDSRPLKNHLNNTHPEYVPDPAS